jgi:hypothetical protein
MNYKYKRLENLFVALLAVQTVYTLTALFISSNDISLVLPINRAFIKVFIMIQILITVAYGNYYFSTKFKLAEKVDNADRKRQFYYSAYSVRIVLLTICNLINVTAFLITSNEIYTVITVPLLFLYFIYKPNRKMFETLPEAAD